METAKPKFCESCGKPLLPDARFCEECGHAVEVEPPAPPPNTQLSALPPPVQVPPPAFVQPPPQLQVATPPAVPLAPNASVRGGNGMKAVLIVAGVLVLCCLGFLVLYAGKQVWSRFTASQHPASPSSQASQTAPPQTIRSQTTPAPVAAPTSQTRDTVALSAQAQQWVDRGYAQEKAGNLKEAVTDYEQALKITANAELAAHIQQLKQTPASEATPSTASVEVSREVLQAAKTFRSTMNKYAVENGVTRANTFVIPEPMLVTYIMTYHWNNGRGMTPGVIALDHEDGTRYGVWQAKGSSGQGGVPNASWIVVPRVVLKPGKYTLFDSHPASWSQNAATGGQGMCEIRGLPWRQETGPR